MNAKNLSLTQHLKLLQKITMKKGIPLLVMKSIKKKIFLTPRERVYTGKTIQLY